MNIDQLLSLDKADKMTGLLSDNSQNLKNNSQNYFNVCNDKGNSSASISNQIAFNFLSNYSNNLNSNTSSLLKAANQLGFNSNLLENFLMKTSPNRSPLKNDQEIQSSDFQNQKGFLNLSMLSDTKKNRDLDENHYNGYFNQLSSHLANQAKSTMNQSINSKRADANQAQLNNQIQQQQSLAAVVAACYSTNSLNSSLTNNKLAPFGLEMSKQSNNMLSLNNRTNCLLNDIRSNRNFNSFDCPNEIKHRPASENSLNGSILSTEIDFEFNDVDLNVKRKPTEFNNNKSSLSSQRANLNEKDDSEEERSDSQLELNSDNGASKCSPFTRMYLNGLEGLNERIFNEYQDWAKRTYLNLNKIYTY